MVPFSQASQPRESPPYPAGRRDRRGCPRRRRCPRRQRRDGIGTPPALRTATAAPVLRVSGATLKWNRINKIRRYELATVHHPATTRNTTYRIVKGTNFKPASSVGQTGQVRPPGRHSERSLVQGGQRRLRQAEGDRSRSCGRRAAPTPVAGAPVTIRLR